MARDLSQRTTWAIYVERKWVHPSERQGSKAIKEASTTRCGCFLSMPKRANSKISLMVPMRLPTAATGELKCAAASAQRTADQRVVRHVDSSTKALEEDGVLPRNLAAELHTATELQVRQVDPEILVHALPLEADPHPSSQQIAEPLRCNSELETAPTVHPGMNGSAAVGPKRVRVPALDGDDRVGAPLVLAPPDHNELCLWHSCSPSVKDRGDLLPLEPVLSQAALLPILFPAAGSRQYVGFAAYALKAS